MWQPMLNVLMKGPATYEFSTPSPPAIPGETEFVIQDVDPQDQPVVHRVTGQTALEYTFPRPGQYRVTVRTYRIQPDVPDITEFGVYNQILRIVEPPADPPEDPPVVQDPPEDPPVRPPSGQIPRLIDLGLRVCGWLVGTKPTVVGGFVAGLVLGGGAVYVLMTL